MADVYAGTDLGNRHPANWVRALSPLPSVARELLGTVCYCGQEGGIFD
jgi:hypothetical protein